MADTIKSQENVIDATGHQNQDIAQVSEVQEHNIIFNITMTCTGCSGAVERVLKKLDGGLLNSLDLTLNSNDADKQIPVKSYDVSLENQTATITTTPDVSWEDVFEKVKKTGKKINTIKVDGKDVIQSPTAA